MAGTFNTVHLFRSVDLFTLRLFMTVMEEGQVGRAAARENIAASAATKRIQDLEEIVGLPLFERNPRGVSPTTAGLVFARHIANIVRTFEDIRRDFNEFTEGVRGTIRVTSTGSLISQYLSREIAEFTRNFPQVDIDLREGNNFEVIRTVTAGEADIAVFSALPGTIHPEVDTIEYRNRDSLLAVVPIGHPLAERKHVKVIDLFEHNFIAIDTHTTLMSHVRHVAAQAGIVFDPKYTVNSVYAASALVRVRLGVTIQPEGLLSIRDLESVCTVPLEETWALRRLLIGTPSGRTMTAATRNFIAQLTGQPK